MTDAVKASEFEGHVHEFPKLVDASKTYTCKSCGEEQQGMFILAARAEPEPPMTGEQIVAMIRAYEKETGQKLLRP